MGTRTSWKMYFCSVVENNFAIGNVQCPYAYSTRVT